MEFRILLVWNGTQLMLYSFVIWRWKANFSEVVDMSILVVSSNWNLEKDICWTSSDRVWNWKTCGLWQLLGSKAITSCGVSHYQTFSQSFKGSVVKCAEHKVSCRSSFVTYPRSRCGTNEYDRYWPIKLVLYREAWLMRQTGFCTEVHAVDSFYNRVRAVGYPLWERISGL